MTDDQIPETPTELAKRLWDTALQHLQQATDETDCVIADAYVHIGELALKAAQFALANPALLAGIPDSDPENFGLPHGAPPLPASITGAPPLPIWGGQQ